MEWNYCKYIKLTKPVREGGILTELLQQYPQFDLVEQRSTVDIVTLMQSMQAVSAQLGTNAIQSLDQLPVHLYPSLQKLQNAGITVTLGQLQNLSGMALEGVDPQALVSIQPIELVMPMGRAADVINILPDFVLFPAIPATTISPGSRSGLA